MLEIFKKKCYIKLKRIHNSKIVVESVCIKLTYFSQLYYLNKLFLN